MRLVALEDATGSLNEYARSARKEPLVLTLKGKPVMTLAPVTPHTDLENLTVTTHPKFQAIMARAQARYQAEGGLSTEEVRRRLAERRRAAKKAR